ncbi:hypothetical protein LX32DRAFT_441744 [Colletotrichum zoysiae]|uniref:Uncharacterized protein n=1 Tax=Colletotrichum zoysiae TaxID=1216348 RepID=A0AAD9M4H3_9PEZI|nr:hypothetical protein LX32DRAFT_441744 [Colletotrichum zoysiae]
MHTYIHMCTSYIRPTRPTAAESGPGIFVAIYAYLYALSFTPACLPSLALCTLSVCLSVSLRNRVWRRIPCAQWSVLCSLVPHDPSYLLALAECTYSSMPIIPYHTNPSTGQTDRQTDRHTTPPGVSRNPSHPSPERQASSLVCAAHNHVCTVPTTMYLACLSHGAQAD